VNTDRNHLDAETVAAWIDGGLDSASLAAAEAHASNCERCQQLLATVSRTMPATGTVTETGSLKAASISASWWRWWMAPIAATAAAVTLWMVVPQEQLQQVATAPAFEVAAPAEPAAGARARDEAAPPMAQATQPSARADEQKFSEVKRQAETPQRGAQQPPQASQEKLGAATANVADAAAAKAKDRDNKAEDRFARVEAEPARAPAAPPAAAAPAESAATIGNAITQLRKQAAPLVIVSPDPRYRWRATSDGIDFSVDGGRTWLPVRLPQGEVVTGGASPAPLSCWLVGRRGLVLVATDGTNFTRIPFPETVDLASVSSPELRIAIVTTADGRTFRTENAGRAWRQQ
jgi:putative zinc finger protein